MNMCRIYIFIILVFQPCYGTTTHSPSFAPTAKPTSAPTIVPSFSPTFPPTATPTYTPSSAPSPLPTVQPTPSPTAIPTAQPSAVPTAVPSYCPSGQPSSFPSGKPSSYPTSRPTTHPTQHRFVCDTVASTNIKQLVNRLNVWNCSDDGTPLSNPCISWPYISCINNNITSLYFNLSGLAGSIPSSIGKVYSLSAITIMNNFMFGTIPSQIGRLPLLTSLIIDGTSISGTVPTVLSMIPTLRTLRLEYSNFYGELSQEFCPTGDVLPNLARLSINHNPNITCLPDCIANLSHSVLFTAVQVDYNLTYCSVLCKFVMCFC